MTRVVCIVCRRPKTGVRLSEPCNPADCPGGGLIDLDGFASGDPCHEHHRELTARAQERRDALSASQAPSWGNTGQ